MLKPKVFTQSILALSLSLALSAPAFATVTVETIPRESAPAEQSQNPYQKPTVSVTQTSQLAFHPSLGGQKVIALGARADEANQNLQLNNGMVAFDQKVNVAKGSAKTISLFGGAVTGKTTSFEIVEGPRNGSLQALNAAGGLVTYVPDAGFVGEDSFTFRTRDGLKNSNVATVKARVGVGASVNEPAVMLAGDRSLDEFTLELEEDGVEFARKQAERQRDFFTDLRAKDLSADETGRRAREFQKEQAERQRKFSEDRAEKIRKNEEKKAKDADRPEGFQNRDFGFVLKRNQFILNQQEEKNKFIEKLNNRNLSADERIRELNEFFAKQRAEVLEFLEDSSDF